MNEGDGGFVGSKPVPWRALLIGVAAALVAVQFLSRVTQLGDADSTYLISESTYYVILGGAAIVVLARAALSPKDRVGWAFIGLGLVFWAGGDFFYKLSPGGGDDLPYPSLADALYLMLYACTILGVRSLGGRLRGQSLVSPALVVAILGMATLWSWAVFGKVVTSASGNIWAVATTLAYPLLDLVLLVSVLFAVAARGWRFDSVLLPLASGMALLVVADSIYAAEVARGVYEKDSVLEATWPASMVLIMCASLARRAPKADPIESEGLLLSLALLAGAVATCALIADHFSALDTTTVILASLTLAAAFVQVVLLAQERSRADKRAREQEAVRRASIDGAMDCVVSVDAEGRIVDWNRAAEVTFGHRRDVALGERLGSLILPREGRDGTVGPLVALCDGRSERILNRRMEVMARHARGGCMPVELAVIEVQSNPPVYTAFMRDLSRARRRDEENQRLASILRLSDDAVLTLDVAGTVTSWNHGAELLYGFKPEEAVGQPIASLTVPDDRQVELAELMDRILAGEEVVCKTTRRRRDGALLQISLQGFPVRNLAGSVIGATTICHDITDQELRRQREMLDQEAQTWSDRVREGMEDGSLSLWGQPIVHAGGHSVDHHELLLRMGHEGRTVSPGEFLPHIENTALMQDLDKWVIARGLDYALHSPVAINLSARSVARSDLAAYVEAALESREHANNVVLEITETAAVENLSAARNLVGRLAALGCRVALDDFGTGYGSFIYLKHLPVTEIKIDMQFIRNIVNDETDQRIVRSIIAVAKNFGMKTVAEGVEDACALALLESYGVDYLQGYQLGKPAPMTGGETLAARAAAMQSRNPVA